MIKFPGHIVALLKQIPEKEWEGIFTQLVEQKQYQLTGTDDADLPKLKAQAQGILEIKQIFLTERRREAKAE